jgi:hypothetical protein
MHAAIVRADIPGGTNEARLKNLREQVATGISGAPGFIAGYWCEPVDDQGLAFVVFQDGASAKAAAPPVGTDMGDGVTIASIEFREVLANA